MKKILKSKNLPQLLATTEIEDVIGKINTPPGVKEQTDFALRSGQIGVGENPLLFFASNMLKIATVVAGLWVLFNILLAGYDFISGQGKPENFGKVQQKLTMSLIGLILIITAYTVAGVISLIMFGDAAFILKPQF